MNTETFDTPCLCLARDARQLEPESYKWAGGILWGLWPECPTHRGERHVAPVWARAYGRLDAEAASAATGAV